MIEETKSLPTNAMRVYRWQDLPAVREPASYLVENDDQEPLVIVVSNHQRQVLEGLMRSPIYAASYCRISDQVLPLRRARVDIECKMFRNDPDTGRERYGVYSLVSKVVRRDVQRVAA